MSRKPGRPRIACEGGKVVSMLVAAEAARRALGVEARFPPRFEALLFRRQRWRVFVAHDFAGIFGAYFLAGFFFGAFFFATAFFGFGFAAFFAGDLVAAFASAAGGALDFFNA